MTELKPCPFCGCERIGFDGFAGEMTAHCEDCWAKGPEFSYDEEEAIKAWNTRSVNITNYCKGLSDFDQPFDAYDKSKDLGSEVGRLRSEILDKNHQIRNMDRFRLKALDERNKAWFELGKLETYTPFNFERYDKLREVWKDDE